MLCGTKFLEMLLMPSFLVEEQVAEARVYSLKLHHPDDKP